MVRDRLDQLKRECQLRNNIDDQNQIMIDIDSNEQEVLKVLNEYTKIKEWLQLIKSNTEDMRIIVSEMMKSFQNPKNFSNQMDEKRVENIDCYKKICSLIKNLEAELPSDLENNAVARIKKTQLYATKEHLLIVWKEYSQFLLQYEDKFKKLITKQAKIVNPNITDEETQELIDNNRTTIFTENILQESDGARQVLRELVERYNELQKIEKSLIEVNNMFIQLNALVMDQGETIRSIQYHAELAVSNIDYGTNKLEKAAEFKVKALKRKTCILIWVTIVLIIIILILVLL